MLLTQWSASAAVLAIALALHGPSRAQPAAAAPSGPDQILAAALKQASSTANLDYYNVAGTTRFDGTVLRTKRLVFQPDGVLQLGAITAASIMIYADELFVDTPQRGNVVIEWAAANLDGQDGLDYYMTCRPGTPADRHLTKEELFSGMRPLLPPIGCTQNDAAASSTSSSPGAPGRHGWDGGPGGDSVVAGPFPWKMPDLTIYFGKITTREGATTPSLVKIHVKASGLDGGRGGNGGDGQSGGHGVKGDHARADYFTCVSGAGYGGVGGNAGKGGRGGRGGNGADGPTVIIVTDSNTHPISNFFDIRMSGGGLGRGGAVGRPGSPGQGGDAGDPDPPNCRAEPQRRGHSGQGANPPANGSGPQGGNGKDGAVYFRQIAKLL